MKNVTRILSLFSVLFVFSTLAFSNPTFDAGVQMYMSKKYDKAIEAYQSLVNEGFKSHALYYNLACAYFKNSDFAHSMLWFERAKRLNPSDEDTEFNINVTKYKLTDKIEAVPEIFFITWWKSFLSLMSEKQWAIFSIILLFFVFASVAIFLITSLYWLRKTTFFTGIFCLFFFVVAFLSAYSQKQTMQRTDEAIVMVKKMEVKSSPDATSKDLFVVHEGLKIKIQDRIGDWVEIRLPNGDKGWVTINELEVI